jgi:hypothetical protein
VHVVSRLRAFDVRVVCTEAGIYDDGVISVTSIVSRDATRHGPGQGLCELEYDFVGQAGETRAPWHCEDLRWSEWWIARTCWLVKQRARGRVNFH